MFERSIFYLGLHWVRTTQNVSNPWDLRGLALWKWYHSHRSAQSNCVTVKKKRKRKGPFWEGPRRANNHLLCALSKCATLTQEYPLAQCKKGVWGPMWKLYYSDRSALSKCVTFMLPLGRRISPLGHTGIIRRRKRVLKEEQNSILEYLGFCLETLKQCTMAREYDDYK